MDRKRPFNGSPTVDGYYTTFDSSEVHRPEESDGGDSKFRIVPLTFDNDLDENVFITGPFCYDGDDVSLLTVRAYADAETVSVINTALYGGLAEVFIEPETEGASVVGEGDVQYNEGNLTYFIVSGPATFTIGHIE